ncbi:hypothetical protein BC831DRAFT_439767 [Entophlyctis helioformis]|nr:hypothetical protein BC831DRAFT_439767 [Entophlyctis helioformis]
MGSVASSLSIFINYFQNLSIITSVNIQWPTELQPLVSAMRYIRIDLATRIGDWSLPPLDFRGQYIVLVDILPLVVAFMLLAFFQPLYVILWYLILLASMASIICGGLLIVFPSTSAWYSFPSEAPAILVGVGCTVLALAVATYMTQLYIKRRMWYKRRATIHNRSKSIAAASERMSVSDIIGAEDFYDEEGVNPEKEDMLEASLRNRRASLAAYSDSGSDSDDDMQYYTSAPDLRSIRTKREYPRPAIWKLAYRVTLGSLLIFFGLCIGDFLPAPFDVLSITATVVNADSSVLTVVPKTFAVIMVIFGIAFFVNFLFNIHPQGRVYIQKAKAFSLWNMGTFVFMFMFATYIPVTTSLLGSFACSWETCAPGSEFAVNSVSLGSTAFASNFYSSATSGRACFACNFDAQTCPIASTLCPGERDLRLNADKSLSCLSEILPYYGPGAALMFLAIGFGIPLLFYRLVSLAALLVQSIPPDPLNDITTESTWAAQMQLSANLCRALYYGYKYQWRYYTLITLLQKMAIVSIYVFALYISSNAIGAVLAVHAVYFVIAIVYRPYMKAPENLLNITCLFINTLNATISFATGLGSYAFPDAVLYFLTVLNFGVPIFLFIYLCVVDVKRTKALKKELKAKKRMDAALTELVSQLDEQMDAYTVKLLVRYFMGVGLVSFFSLSLTAVGLIKAILGSNTFQSSVPPGLSTASDIATYEFAGYTSWTEFTQNCCCENNTNSTANEIWKCMPNTRSNGEFVYKLRARTDTATGSSGLLLRGYCSTTFNSTSVCSEPAFNSTLRRYAVTACTASNATALELSQYW